MWPDDRYICAHLRVDLAGLTQNPGMQKEIQHAGVLLFHSVNVINPFQSI